MVFIGNLSELSKKIEEELKNIHKTPKEKLKKIPSEINKSPYFRPSSSNVFKNKDEQSTKHKL